MGKRWENRHNKLQPPPKITFGMWFRANRTSVLKVLPLGVILPMLIFFASVGPDDVAKNYAGWARKFGLTDFANTLAIYATGPRVFWGVIVVTVVYVFIAFVLPALIKRSQKDKAAVVVPVSVALIVAFAVYGQYAVSYPAERHVSESQRAKLKELISPIADSFPRA